jgi:biopolymer transport protein ExbB/TolQ
MFGISTDLAAQFVETVLYSISSILYLPVLVALVCLVLYLLVCLGGFAGEWRARRRGVRPLVIEAERQMATEAAASPAASSAASSVFPALDARLERILQKAESTGLRRLDTVRFIVRVAPALGLMGTLIPMGISLAGLAQGNLPKMAESMTTAFTAAVVGLACSVLAYLLTLVRDHWLRNDLTDIAFSAESVLANHKPAAVLHAVRTGG